ncbi:MAG: hypothetical protein WC125_07305 [Bacteroidales bacterium]
MSYIGQTCVEKQRRSDFLNLNRQYSGKRIENARKKYGPQAFNYEILEKVSFGTEEGIIRILNELEIFYIDKYNSFRNGYNNTIGGGGANGYRHTNEYKKWQSEKTKDLIKNPEYRKSISEGIKSFYNNNPHARKEKSNETKKRYEDPSERQKTSIAHKKSYLNNPDRARKQAKKLSETCLTHEGRKRMSLTIKNAWKTDEYREKYSTSKKVLWATEEYRKKMAIAYKGMNGKKVLQLALDNTPIQEFESATEAARKLGYSFGGICRVCRGERSVYKSYKWMYI